MMLHSAPSTVRGTSDVELSYRYFVADTRFLVQYLSGVEGEEFEVVLGASMGAFNTASVGSPA